MIRDVVIYDVNKKHNNEILHKKLRKVTDFKSDEVIRCIQDLNDTLDEIIRKEGNKRGAIGLSANQIDIDLAVSAVTLRNKRHIFINPKVLEENGKDRLFRIGCFSVCDYRAMVRYNDDVIIGYDDEDGDPQMLRLKGDQSCVVQHEMDHLQGMLLFEKAQDREHDFFIPRETVYKDGTIPLRNHGWIFELRRRLGLQKAMTSPAYHSSLFNDYTDYEAFVRKTAKENKELLETIDRHSSEPGRILETGETTSALSVYLNRDNYQNEVCQFHPDMYDLSVRINAQNKTDVLYSKGSLFKLPYEDHSFDTIFTCQILETLNEKDLVRALSEGLRVADTYVFPVPTIKIRSNLLKGNEILRSRKSWEKILKRNGFRIIEEILSEDGGTVIFVIRRS